MTARILFAGDASTVDLFAGWSWSPFTCYDSPYRYGGYPFWPIWPHAGLGVPFDGCDDTPPYSPYGYYRYDPLWGYEYGIRIKLNGTQASPTLSTELLPPPPGSAPTLPHDLSLEKNWDHDIESFLGTLDTEWWKRSLTNKPPEKGTPLN